MIITLVAKFSARKITPAEAYAQAGVLLDRMAPLHADFRQWWSSPRGPKDRFVAFSDRDQIIARMEEEAGRFPELQEKGAPSVVLTNAGNETDWKNRGRISVVVNPSFGVIRMSINDVRRTFASPVEIVWGVLEQFCKTPGIRIAQTNVKQRVGDEVLLYSLDRAPFPHREFLGWMGYVSAPLTHAQVPDAARLQPRGDGTLVLATELLDMSNPAALKQANQVEMSLVDLDLLAVTDPSLK